MEGRGRGGWSHPHPQSSRLQVGAKRAEQLPPPRSLCPCYWKRGLGEHSRRPLAPHSKPLKCMGSLSLTFAVGQPPVSSSCSRATCLPPVGPDGARPGPGGIRLGGLHRLPSPCPSASGTAHGSLLGDPLGHSGLVASGGGQHRSWAGTESAQERSRGGAE